MPLNICVNSDPLEGQPENSSNPVKYYYKSIC